MGGERRAAELPHRSLLGRCGEFSLPVITLTPSLPCPCACLQLRNGIPKLSWIAFLAPLPVFCAALWDTANREEVLLPCLARFCFSSLMSAALLVCARCGSCLTAPGRGCRHRCSFSRFELPPSSSSLIVARTDCCCCLPQLPYELWRTRWHTQDELEAFLSQTAYCL